MWLREVDQELLPSYWQRFHLLYPWRNKPVLQAQKFVTIQANAAQKYTILQVREPVGCLVICIVILTIPIVIRK